MSLLPGSIITPLHMITPAEEHALKQGLVPRLTAALQKAGGNTQATIIVRDLVAADLVSGVTRLQNGNSTSLGKTTFTSLFSTAPALTAVQAVAIFGFQSFQASPAPAIDILKFMVGAGGTPIAQINVSSIYGDNRIAKGFFEPLIWLPLETIDCQALANATVAQNGETFNFLGLIAEPSGKTFTPRRDVTQLVPVN